MCRMRVPDVFLRCSDVSETIQIGSERDGGRVEGYCNIPDGAV